MLLDRQRRDTKMEGLSGLWRLLRVPEKGGGSLRDGGEQLRCGGTPVPAVSARKSPAQQADQQAGDVCYCL